MSKTTMSRPNASRVLLDRIPQPAGASAETSLVDQAPQADVGRGLRTLRLRRGLSIRALAERSGLNVNTLSLIENGKTSPSVHTLQLLARALEAPVTAFFEIGVPQNHVVYTKAGQQAASLLAHGTLADLGAGMAERLIEPFLVTLEPNLGSGQEPIVHTGHEFVFCIRGRVLYTVEGHSYWLEAGDSLLFDASLPHRGENVDGEVSQALLVMCPAGAHGQLSKQHVALN